MFELLRSQSRSATGAIKYVTIGVLLIIWASLWYYYFLLPVPDASTWQRFACVGTIFSGFAIGAIGLLFGLIGRGAKGADNTVGVTATPSATPLVTMPPSIGNVSGVVGTPIVPSVAMTGTTVRTVK